MESWYLDGAIPFLAISVLIVAFVLAWIAWRTYFADMFGTSALAAVAASAVLGWGVYAFAVPLLRSVAISPRLAATVGAAPCLPTAYATAGFREPSLVFLTSTDLLMTDGAGAAEFMSSKAPDAGRAGSLLSKSAWSRPSSPERSRPEPPHGCCRGWKAST